MPEHTNNTENEFEKPLKVTRLRGPLSEDEFDAEYHKLGNLHGRTAVEAQAKHDQSFSRFYLYSQWTQERLAVKLGLSQTTISFTLRFGHFLNYAISRVKLSDIGLVCHNFKRDQNSPLTQEKWRAYWLDTDGDLMDRYDLIIRSMKDPNWKSHRGTKTKTTALSTQLVQDENEDLRGNFEELQQRFEELQNEREQVEDNLRKTVSELSQESEELKALANAYTLLLTMGKEHDIEGIADSIITMYGPDIASKVADKIKAKLKRPRRTLS